MLNEITGSKGTIWSDEFTKLNRNTRSNDTSGFNGNMGSPVASVGSPGPIRPLSLY